MTGVVARPRDCVLPVVSGPHGGVDKNCRKNKKRQAVKTCPFCYVSTKLVLAYILRLRRSANPPISSSPSVAGSGIAPGSGGGVPVPQ